jgi:RNA polymerase sigma-70 factor (ECF subfamily)
LRARGHEVASSVTADRELQLLVERARAGDTRAFEDLARREERALYRHALRIVGTTADAEDVVQDALFSAWRSIASFQGLSFRAWLFRIATNRALDHLRSRKRRPELPLEPPEDEDVTWAEPAEPGPDLTQLAGDREALALVETALQSLPADQRTALLLRDIEGFAYEEISLITSVEIGTVKSRIHRGRLAVRNVLVARGWDGPDG